MHASRACSHCARIIFARALLLVACAMTTCARVTTGCAHALLLVACARVILYTSRENIFLRSRKIFSRVRFKNPRAFCEAKSTSCKTRRVLPVVVHPTPLPTFERGKIWEKLRFSQIFYFLGLGYEVTQPCERSEPVVVHTLRARENI